VLQSYSSLRSQSNTVDDLSIHRTKGRVLTTLGTTKMIQGVREVFEVVDVETYPQPPGRQDESAIKQEGKLVLIGRGLSEIPVEESLRSVLGI